MLARSLCCLPVKGNWEWCSQFQKQGAESNEVTPWQSWSPTPPTMPWLTHVFLALLLQPTNNSRSAAKELSMVLRAGNGGIKCMRGGERANSGRRVGACSLCFEAWVNLLWHPLTEQPYIRQPAQPVLKYVLHENTLEALFCLGRTCILHCSLTF